MKIILAALIGWAFGWMMRGIFDWKRRTAWMERDDTQYIERADGMIDAVWDDPPGVIDAEFEDACGACGHSVHDHEHGSGRCRACMRAITADCGAFEPSSAK